MCCSSTRTDGNHTASRAVGFACLRHRQLRAQRFPGVRRDAQAGQRLKRVGRSLVGCQRGFEGDFATTVLGVEVVALAAADDARDTAVGSKDGTARVAFESVQIGDEVGMPADAITPIIDTVIVRPDPTNV
jgi:hypothetical protein